MIFPKLFFFVRQFGECHHHNAEHTGHHPTWTKKEMGQTLQNSIEFCTGLHCTHHYRLSSSSRLKLLNEAAGKCRSTKWLDGQFEIHSKWPVTDTVWVSLGNIVTASETWHGPQTKQLKYLGSHHDWYHQWKPRPAQSEIPAHQPGQDQTGLGLRQHWEPR